MRNEPQHFAAAGVTLGFLRHPTYELFRLLLLKPLMGWPGGDSNAHRPQKRVSYIGTPDHLIVLLVSDHRVLQLLVLAAHFPRRERNK